MHELLKRARTAHAISRQTHGLPISTPKCEVEPPTRLARAAVSLALDRVLEARAVLPEVDEHTTNVLDGHSESAAR